MEFGQEGARLHKHGAVPAAGQPPPLNRLVAEFGLRSFETLREWALWALEHLGANTAPAH